MGFILFIALIVGFIIFSSKSAKKAQEKWAHAAKILGLGYYTSGRTASGTIMGTTQSGHEVTVTTFSRNTGKSSQTYTQYSLRYRTAFPVDFKISRQGFMHGLGEVFGLRDIEVGHPDFDRKILVKGKHPDAVIKFLTAERQQHIIQLIQSYNEVVLTNEKVTIIKRGKDVEPPAIVHSVRALLSFCDAIMAEKTPAASPPPSPPLSPPPPLPPAAILEEKPILPVPPPVPEEIPATQKPVPPEQPEQPVQDLQKMVESLFSMDTGNSLLLAKTFDEQFKGKAVAGSGILKRVNKFSYDPVFTNCKGALASIEICEIKGAYSKSKIMVVAKFPEEQYEALKSKTETPMKISGTLFALNAMLHQVYVSTD